MGTSSFNVVTLSLYTMFSIVCAQWSEIEKSVQILYFGGNFRGPKVLVDFPYFESVNSFVISQSYITENVSLNP